MIVIILTLASTLLDNNQYVRTQPGVILSSTSLPLVACPIRFVCPLLQQCAPGEFTTHSITAVSMIFFFSLRSSWHWRFKVKTWAILPDPIFFVFGLRKQSIKRNDDTILSVFSFTLRGVALLKLKCAGSALWCRYTICIQMESSTTCSSAQLS